jgi:hemerythrin
MADCLGHLHTRLAAHFALEENTMRAINNPYYAAHKTEHDRFLAEVTDVVANFGEEFDHESMDGLARRVWDWIFATSPHSTGNW